MQYLQNVLAIERTFFNGSVVALRNVELAQIECNRMTLLKDGRAKVKLGSLGVDVKWLFMVVVAHESALG